MKTQFYFFIVGLTLIFIMPSCKRFEDGNNFSIRTVKGRLVKGSPWVFEKLEVDGIDKSDEFRADSSFILKMNFYKVHPNDIDEEFTVEIYNPSCYSSGNFEYSKPDKFKIFAIENGCVFTEFDHYSYGPIFKAQWIEWIITRLSIKEFHFKTNYFGKEYKLYLKSQEE